MVGETKKVRRMERNVYVKHPMGVIPEHAYEGTTDDRIKHITRAIDRYQAAGLKPPDQWRHQRAALRFELALKSKESREEANHGD